MNRSLSFLLVFGLSLFTSANSLAESSSINAPATVVAEGPDPQSPEKIERARRNIESLFHNLSEPHAFSKEWNRNILDQYQHLDPLREIPSDLLETTVLFFDQNKTKFPNQSYLAIVDFKTRSDNYRFFLVNLQTGAVEKYHTTHGEGSDRDEDGIAERFSNVPGSKASSLGFIRTGEVYSGAYKRSIRLDGLSTTNSNIRQRAIVLHGWDGAYERNEIQGWSEGCLAFDWKVKDQIIDKLKGGALIYVGVSSR